MGFVASYCYIWSDDEKWWSDTCLSQQGMERICILAQLWDKTNQKNIQWKWIINQKWFVHLLWKIDAKKLIGNTSEYDIENKHRKWKDKKTQE